MDPVSDMFIRIKNAQKAGHETVQFPYSKFKHEILKVLERSGFIGKIERKGKRVKKALEADLLYKDEKPGIEEIKLISKPSRRLYANHKSLRFPRHGGIIVISTPKGVLTGKEAKNEKVGGELIAEIW